MIRSFPYHTRQFAQLPDLFRRLIDMDPDGLYILSMLPVSCEIPGMDSSEKDKTGLHASDFIRYPVWIHLY